MKRALPILGCAALAACGDLSNQDLLFLMAVPTAKEVELRVEQQTPTAASPLREGLGEPATLYANAYGAATDLNKGVADLLELVDSLGRGYPPTERTEEARIWGPVANVDGSGVTMRLEIRRTLGIGETPAYLFCLQFAHDAEVSGEPASCEDPQTGGYHTPLSGHYQPLSAGEGARSGQGSIRLDFEAMHAVGLGKPDERGVLDLSYDFSRGGAAKQLHIDVTGPLSTGSIPQRATYDYGCTTDGHVDFYFSVENQLEDDATKPQSWIIDAVWAEGDLGRADAMGRGGDLAVDQVAAAVECWDRYYRRTYYRVAVYRAGVEQVVLANEGSEAACPARNGG